MTDRLKVHNWEKFQHYKDRRPPWIKLHVSLLTDPDFLRLPVASKALLTQLWLLASHGEGGIIPYSIKDIALILHYRQIRDSVLQPLIDAGFIEIASDVPADCKQHAMPEKRREEERREEERGDSRNRDQRKPAEIVKDLCKRTTLP